MKIRSTITILLFTITTILSAQDFEGTLTYSMDFTVSEKMLDMGISKEMLVEKMKEDGSWVDTVKISYKNGFYKQLNLAAGNKWTIYRPDSNNLYFFQDGEGSDICTIKDASVDLEQKMTGNAPTVTQIDTLVNYDEFDLNMVEVKWSLGAYYYLFDDNYFKISPEDYKGHIYDGFYGFLKVSNSLPVKIIKEAGPMMTITLSLVEFEETEIDDSIFTIPVLVEDEELSGLNFGAGKMMKIKE